jgi:DNA (cytosine-5)-methyltransferase 1
VDNPEKTLATLSLCHGQGGLDRGLERGIAALRYPHQGEKMYQARILQYAAIVEIESFAAYNVAAKMEQGMVAPVPIWTDLKTFPYEQFYRKIHILTGGYPCQPFSQAGLQNGVADPRHLFPFFEHGIDAVRPVLCFFENVANHLNIGYQEVRERISSLGYKVEADIFAAEQVGTPHLRKRLFILAVADTYCSEQSKRRGDLAEVLGLSEVKCQPEHRSVISGGDSEKVDDIVIKFNQQKNKISTRRNSITSSSQTMDNSFQSRLEGHGRHGNAKKRWEESVRSIAQTSLFPAGQGPNQFEFEEPRLESSLGYAINGYNFREDLLRMAGNAVVEQQAELAFRTLIEKFL